MEKIDFFEFSSIYIIYQIGVVYLSKYVANHGVDFYQDSVITAYTDIKQLKNRLKDDTYRNNWYIGKQYTSDSHKIKISNIINSVNQPVNAYYTVKNRPENESLIIKDKKTNSYPNNSLYNTLNDNNFKSVYNNYYFNINTNIDTNTTNESIKQNISVDYIETNDGLINICDKILELIYNSVAETKYDINLNQEICDFVDTYYYQNIKSKSYCCKDCYRHKHDYCNDKTKENFLELLKILKYFYNIDEYVPQNCDIYNCNEEINNYLYTDSSIPTYQYFYDKLIDMKKYFKEASVYSDNFGYLINKANHSIRFGLDYFDNDVVFNNSYF
ncbi:hypothetical protein LY90DRAFT_513439 [Neocallimastix californiae]|uniref:Uncharacterized protein n=1 Tax=Neocallimastix californiae TaxID=1754190 RepID=A0A1Y2AXS8_9FUNG|nr:hypothetical protein LY90DRAFT_513439 [Neocallimastix californiae]|eukprot:ORY27393.1 hypothetical protein LY90DRAFT_513439 [Neocallimastix californiae]